MAKKAVVSTPAKRKMEQTQTQPPLSPSGRSYKIGGISVDFPYKPYGSQLAYMAKVIAALERSHRYGQGHCHALLESPTGSGKSLSLLCAALAWQHQYKSRAPSCPPFPAPNRPAQTPISPTETQRENALAVGGGFIPEDSQPGLGLALGESQQAAPEVSNGAEKKPKVPTIFYASWKDSFSDQSSNSGISQNSISGSNGSAGKYADHNIEEIASRKHYCTNKRVCAKKNVDEECKLLLKDSEQSCPHFKNAYKVKYHPSLRKGGCNEVHDIEDLVNVGHLVKGCSYFAARDMALEAQLVFCPYSYILNPIIRRAMEVDIKGAIVILDEAHNIEDMSREAGSLDVEEKILDVLQTELGQLSLTDSVTSIYQPLFDMIQGITHWIRQKSNNLEKREFEQYCSCWTGDKALRELQAAGISQEYFPILQECAIKAIKAASETEKDGFHLSGLSASTLEGLFSSLTYFFSENAHRASEYQLGLQRYVKRDEGMAVQGWTHSFSLWCLNPAVVFKEIAEASASVILTSGTLSPMNSFASELGVPFEICMEAPHVINLDSQVWAAAVAAGPGNVSLNASYKTADGYAFQEDALGGALEEICKVVPDGILVFFPSYKLMEKLCNRWKATGQWTRLNQQKPLFVEPRGNQDNFEPILSGYYSAIRGEKKRVVRKLKDGRKHVPNPSSSKEGLEVRSKGGAAFLAVCRGKVSEGIDFSDENARAVVVVGIPFPNKKDIQVELKKRYNNINRSSKNLLSGDQWYCHQAFRALNQAVGRCIRHRLDFGAIILLDERFKKSSNLEYMSKWLRNSIRQFDNFEQSLEGLHNFFSKVEDKKPEIDAEINNLITRTCVIDDSDTVTCKENMSASKVNLAKKGVAKMANRKMQDFYRQIDEENNMTQKVTMASQSMRENGPSSDFEMNTSKDMSTSSTLNIINDIVNKPAIQRKVDVSLNAENHADPTQNIHAYSKYFARSPLRETSNIQGSVLTDNRENMSIAINSSSASLLSQADVKIGHLCSDENLCDIKTPRQTVAAFESGQLSYGSPDLGKNSGGPFCRERLNPLNSTPGRGSEDSLFSKHYLSNPVGMSKNSCCRKRRSPIRIQLDDDMKTKLFVHPTERNDLDQQCKTECSTPPENKMVQCQKLGNACLEESPPVSICNQYASNLVPNSTTQSTVAEGSNGSGNRYGVLLQSQSIESSTLQAQNRQSDTSISLEHHSESIRPASTNMSEKTCFISCTYCGNPFGLPEKQFLVSCIVTSLSKSYFNILGNRNQECLPNGDTLQDRAAMTPVIISDLKFLNQLFSRGGPSQGSLTSSNADNEHKSIWVEEDGCVFRALFCPHCEASNACVGVHVMATDVSNISLLDKVVFFRNHVKVVDAELVAQREVNEHAIKTDTSKVLNISSIEDYSYGSNLKRPRCMAVSRTKLRLPKKE